MKLTFIGAAHEVTGSCHYLEAGGKHILIDCGMEQGVQNYEKAELPVGEAMVDYVTLSFSNLPCSLSLSIRAMWYLRPAYSSTRLHPLPFAPPTTTHIFFLNIVFSPRFESFLFFQCALPVPSLYKNRLF